MKMIEPKKRNARVLVVDHENKPMTFDGKQFCYSEVDRRFQFWAKAYTETEALRLIKKSHAFRKRKKYKLFEYQVMLLETEDRKYKIADVGFRNAD